MHKADKSVMEQELKEVSEQIPLFLLLLNSEPQLSPPREMEPSSQDKTWQRDFGISFHLYSYRKAEEASQKLSH